VSVMSIKFTDVTEDRRGSDMRYERSVMVMTLLQLDYLVHSLGNCGMTLSIETGLIFRFVFVS